MKKVSLNVQFCNSGRKSLKIADIRGSVKIMRGHQNQFCLFQYIHCGSNSPGIQYFYLPTIFSTHTKAVNWSLWRKLKNRRRRRRFGTYRIIQNSTSKTKKCTFCYGRQLSYPTEFFKNRRVVIENELLECRVHTTCK